MILVYTEINKGKVKKASLEAINYGAKIAELTNSSVTAIAINADASQIEEIGKAGAKKILSVKNESLIGLDNFLLKHRHFDIHIFFSKKENADVFKIVNLIRKKIMYFLKNKKKSKHLIEKLNPLWTFEDFDNYYQLLQYLKSKAKYYLNSQIMKQFWYAALDADK